MIASRSLPLLRAASKALPRRNLAILPTVKVAADTSKIDFPTPSHVGLTAEAADLAKQITDFYSNPESVISLSDEAREAMQMEIEKKLQGIPDSGLPSDFSARELQVPTEIRLGENPLFGSARS